ncbi:uncharacterized protein SPPG_09369 [Spizellomyces punctatus DAOM BR117]|uniref:Uncharacterized protein n=1 Tax=Spizellomyces punctatus (strain DAOM BR117) TaxID=645134 RepID=A0A0L0HBA0_SPIPD|nr:uncharacterized protein SPPG_09369 [Spizellomyces punctatus DAOM BR117]KNC98003.1 hypothetical protein SPPG_09369 [Spizellomyces punctatus DAOM BR117]|eukprot:XP_016606043.1 hypothetical protein SPPG_09369 [Spizellomyces punctatus DAOM BR117]
MFRFWSSTRLAREGCVNTDEDDWEWVASADVSQEAARTLARSHHGPDAIQSWINTIRKNHHSKIPSRKHAIALRSFHEFWNSKTDKWKKKGKKKNRAANGVDERALAEEIDTLSIDQIKSPLPAHYTQHTDTRNTQYTINPDAIQSLVNAIRKAQLFDSFLPSSPDSQTIPENTHIDSNRTNMASRFDHPIPHPHAQNTHTWPVASKTWIRNKLAEEETFFHPSLPPRLPPLALSSNVPLLASVDLDEPFKVTDELLTYLRAKHLAAQRHFHRYNTIPAQVYEALASMQPIGLKTMICVSRIQHLAAQRHFHRYNTVPAQVYEALASMQPIGFKTMICVSRIQFDLPASRFIFLPISVYGRVGLSPGIRETVSILFWFISFKFLFGFFKRDVDCGKATGVVIHRKLTEPGCYAMPCGTAAPNRRDNTLSSDYPLDDIRCIQSFRQEILCR